MMLYPNGSATRPAVSSPFGPRRGGAFSFHYGADCIGFRNVCAVAGGKVTFAGWLNPAAGYTIIVDHGGGVTSLYMHNERHWVRKGDQVREGQQIALMGDSGNATGDCCHIEIRVHGTSVEPLGYIAARLPRPASGGTTTPPPQEEEEDIMRTFIEASSKGTKYELYRGTKRSVSSDEWDALRALQKTGMPLFLATVPQATINGIPGK